MAKKTKLEREIQVQIREAKRTLKDALKDFVYDKKIDKSEFIKRLNDAKTKTDELMIKVSQETEIKKEGEEIIEE